MTPPVTRKSLWIPATIIGFFLLLMVIEGNFIAIAVSHQSSVVSDDAYEAGLHYNKVLREQAREKALGWNLAIAYVPGGALSGTVQVALKNANGTPLDAAFDATAERLTDHYQSVPLTFVDGRAALKVNVPGRWILRVIAHRNGDQIEREQ